MPLPCTRDAPLDSVSANRPKSSPATQTPMIAPLCSEKKDFAASFAFFGAVNALFRVVLECRKLLTDNNIEKIAHSVAVACEADYDASTIKRIKMAIQETDAAIENLWKALEHGQSVEMIAERIEKRKREKEELQGQLAIEMGKQVSFTAPQVKAFLYSLKRGNINDEHNRRGIINIFLRAIYLFDDRLTLILNGGDRQITIDDILIDEIEEHFADAVSYHARCSPLVAAAPPY